MRSSLDITWKRTPALLVLLLLWSAALISPQVDAQAQIPAEPVVYAVLFWMEGCPQCHEVLDNVIPPIQEKYGQQFSLLLLELKTMEDVNRFYEIAADYGTPREQVGVPLLVVGDEVLIGRIQISKELPLLIERYLAQGGVNLPDIPEFGHFFTGEGETGQTITPISPTDQSGMYSTALVQAVMLNTPDCHDCQVIAAQVLKLAHQDYRDQFIVESVDIVTSSDVEFLYQVASAYGIPKEDLDLPLIIIGDQVLIGEEIPARLPSLIETYLQAGGTESPQIPSLDDLDDPMATLSRTAPHANPWESGFTIAMIVLVLMVSGLVYSLASFITRKTFFLPSWGNWLTLALILVGIGVAGYLSYVETQLVEAICGPVGDCNAVQSSRYARLFGVLPVGVLGFVGYLALLGVWLARRIFPQLSKLAAVVFWGMAVFAVSFSIYLTYLEPFVIKAVCAWCLASSMIMTLLLLLGTPPIIQYSTAFDKDK